MMANITSINNTKAQLVAAPRSTDAIGCALRHVFASPPIPEDLQRLVMKLDSKPGG
jgi:hypothetical protein